MVEHHELQLDPSKLDMLLALVQSNEDGQVCYQELIELVSGNRERTCTGANSDASWELLCIPLHTTTRTQTSYLFFLFLLDFRKVTELIQTEPASSAVAKIDSTI